MRGSRRTKVQLALLQLVVEAAARAQVMLEALGAVHKLLQLVRARVGLGGLYMRE